MEKVNLTKQSINMSKGEIIELSNNQQGLSKVRVELGWKPIKRSFIGIVKQSFGVGRCKSDYDLDLYVIALSEIKSTEVVYYHNLSWVVGRDICIQHHGDSSDKEQITINLDKIPKEFNELIIAITIYDASNRKQCFGNIEDTYIRIVDARGNFEICKYNEYDISQIPEATTFVAGSFNRMGNDWAFKVIGESTLESSISNVVKRFDS